MNNDNLDITINDIINTVKSYDPQANFELIQKAYKIAYEAMLINVVFLAKCILLILFMLL